MMLPFNCYSVHCYVNPWPVGLSDPYCFITVIKADHLEMITRSKHNLEEISKSKKLGLAIKMSKIIPKSLNPTWNQSFELCVCVLVYYTYMMYVYYTDH